MPAVSYFQKVLLDPGRVITGGTEKSDEGSIQYRRRVGLVGYLVMTGTVSQLYSFS